MRPNFGWHDPGPLHRAMWAWTSERDRAKEDKRRRGMKKFLRDCLAVLCPAFFAGVCWTLGLWATTRDEWGFAGIFLVMFAILCGIHVHGNRK